MYGYYPKPSKCILITKPDRVDRANEIFKGSGIEAVAEGCKESGISCEGTRHLGAAVGTTDFKRSYVMKKVKDWIQSLVKLSTIAAVEPHAAFSTFTHCLQSQWTFLLAVCPTPPIYFTFEDAIKSVFIKALLKRDVNDRERDMLSSARLGIRHWKANGRVSYCSHQLRVYLCTPSSVDQTPRVRPGPKRTVRRSQKSEIRYR